MVRLQVGRQKGIKVMLDGQGADEQLLVIMFFWAALATLFKNMRPVSLLRNFYGMRQLHGYSIFGSIKYASIYTFKNSICYLEKLNKRVPYPPSLVRLWPVQAETVDHSGISVRAMERLLIFQAKLTGLNLQMLLHWEDRDSWRIL
jgi:asparagine synthase (glutamine-hydrolysing)